MRIVTFDPGEGIYRFELDSLDTLFHAHPALEVIVATEGHFSVSVGSRVMHNLTCAAIEPNIRHKVMASNCQLQLVMVESKTRSPKAIHEVLGIDTGTGVYVAKTPAAAYELLAKLEDSLVDKDTRAMHDPRTETCLTLLEQEDMEYNAMMQKLSSAVHLSESRISHLFKAHMGVSLKKYLVWCRLKRTIHGLLQGEKSLFIAALDAGFYDQAHVSKAFKEMFGMSPSTVYNSRIVQGYSAPK